MARKPYDPLAMIPDPKTIREQLSETELLAERLRILLELSEKIHAPKPVESPTNGPARADRRR